MDETIDELLQFICETRLKKTEIDHGMLANTVTIRMGTRNHLSLIQKCRIVADGHVEIGCVYGKADIGLIGRG